ncbi:MAG TPA: DNRLRE domain-containing protein, partial [Candidatus Pacearchaeota archaeon]|nr:DNRLRE domain-containing protein [Candidatus Pacearchaeota archaeon]
MQKKRKIITISYILLALISISFLYQTSFQITGLVVYSEQPNATTGKDTYLRENQSTNYGTSTTLRLGTAKTAGGTELRPLLYFDTSTIPSVNTITNANISIYLTSSDTNENLTLNLYRLTSNWTEENASWYNKDASTNWTTPGSDYDTEIIASTIITNQTGWYNFTITTLARNWVNGTSPNYGLMLYAPNANVSNWKEIASSDYTLNTALRPTITIDHTPNAIPTINQIS